MTSHHEKETLQPYASDHWSVLNGLSVYIYSNREQDKWINESWSCCFLLNVAQLKFHNRSQTGLSASFLHIICTIHVAKWCTRSEQRWHKTEDNNPKVKLLVAKHHWRRRAWLSSLLFSTAEQVQIPPHWTFNQNRRWSFKPDNNFTGNRDTSINKKVTRT